MWLLCPLPTVVMHGLFLKKTKHENKLLNLLSRFVKESLKLAAKFELMIKWSVIDK